MISLRIRTCSFYALYFREMIFMFLFDDLFIRRRFDSNPPFVSERRSIDRSMDDRSISRTNDKSNRRISVLYVYVCVWVCVCSMQHKECDPSLNE